MSSLFKQFQTNKEKEQAGVPVEYAANDDGTIPTFYIARMGNYNKNYSKTFERLMKPFKRLFELKSLPDATAEKILLETFAETVLLGWKNVFGEDGKAISYSQEAVIALMKALPELYADLSNQARSAANFKDIELEADAKN